MDLLVLGPDPVRNVLPMDACIEAADSALRARARGTSVQPIAASPIGCEVVRFPRKMVRLDL